MKCQYYKVHLAAIYGVIEFSMSHAVVKQFSDVICWVCGAFFCCKCILTVIKWNTWNIYTHLEGLIWGKVGHTCIQAEGLFLNFFLKQTNDLFLFIKITN